jgi:uncharacterized protein (DUF1330 family)
MVFNDKELVTIEFPRFPVAWFCYIPQKYKYQVDTVQGVSCSEIIRVGIKKL